MNYLAFDGKNFELLFINLIFMVTTAWSECRPVGSLTNFMKLLIKLTNACMAFIKDVIEETGALNN